MNKLKKMLLAIIVLTVWNVNSQEDTLKKKDSVTISRDIAEKIHLDLIDYDRLLENKVEKNLCKCIELQKEKDTIISYLKFQNKISKETLLLSEKQIQIKNQQIKFHRKKGKGWIWGSGGAIVGVVLTLLVSK